LIIDSKKSFINIFVFFDYKNYLLQQQEVSSGLQRQSIEPSHLHLALMQFGHLHFKFSQSMRDL
tara:strand:+ start:1510 stop:1701 length:192 start_codon:yes stop_codon:yes gene_type:complete